MMGAGQNKGALLQLLLASSMPACGTQQKDYVSLDACAYKAIVFVDDGEKNVREMRAAFPNEDWVTVVRYTNLDKAVKEFQCSEDRKIKVNKSWRALQGVICNEVDQYCPVADAPAPVTFSP
jgi:hypothetical protein